MTIALVGSAGAISTVSVATITPAFGQATTAGNLLAARVVAYATGGTVNTIATSSTGWTIVAQATDGVSAGGAYTVVAYRENCGSTETAPTFTVGGTGVTGMAADLQEYSGVAVSLSKDASATFVTGINPPVRLTSGVDNVLVVYAHGSSWSKSATITWTDSWSGTGTTSAAQGDDATKQANHFHGSNRITTVVAGTVISDTVTETPSTGVGQATADVIVSFKPVVIVSSLVYDDRRVRRNSLLRR